MTAIPSQYQGIVNQAAAGTGLPASVVAAQINEESGFNPNAVSPTGAQGMFQFEPSTYASYGSGSPDNPSDEVQAYIKYMNTLLKQEGGSVYKALEAYNAGPANLSAGAGYASTILSNAGAGTSITDSGGSGGGSPASTTPTSGNILTNAAVSAFESLLAAFGITPTSIEDMLERLGLMIVGLIAIFMGIKIFTSTSITTSPSAVSKQFKSHPSEAADAAEVAEVAA